MQHAKIGKADGELFVRPRAVGKHKTGGSMGESLKTLEGERVLETLEGLEEVRAG